jgi:hypothetical protein
MTKNPTRVAAGKKSKNKGASFERKIATRLQEYWRQVRPECSFKRTPGSGGWARANSTSFNASGDIICDDKSFPWCVELKHYKNFSLDVLLSNDAAPILEWWKQAVDETPPGSFPLVICKRNSVEEMVIFDYLLFPTADKSVAELIYGFNHYKFVRPGVNSLIMMTLNDFLRIPPTEIDCRVNNGHM